MKVKGFSAAAAKAGIRYQDRLDLGLIYSEVPAVAAGVFTTNKVKAAPLVLDMERLGQGKAQAVIVNSGNANACTGAKGMEAALSVSSLVAKQLNIDDELVQVASTGVIGMKLDVKPFEKAVPELVNSLSSDGFEDVAKAIMTTDTVSKTASRKIKIDGTSVSILGLAKGSGMIMPDMATMLCFVVTDAQIVFPDLLSVVRSGVEETFNRITVDGDTSTNDMVLVLANGAAGNTWIDDDNPEGKKVFEEAVHEVFRELALMIVADGEGATKLVTIRVTGAREDEGAMNAAQTIGNSALVKTAFFGEDANWGRIIAALGRSDCQFNPDKVAIYFDDNQMVADGVGLGEKAEKACTEVLKKDRFTVTVDLQDGLGTAEVYTCDLSLSIMSGLMPTTVHSARKGPGGRHKIWALPDSLEIEPLLADLSTTFNVRQEKGQVRGRKWFDTDDWRLYRRNLLLFQEQSTWHLMHLDSEEVITTFSGPNCEIYRFSVDFPVSRMRTLLEPIMSIRSLLHLSTQDSITACVHILNNDMKTVALVFFDEHTTRETGAVYRSVTLKGVRGYDSSFRKVSSFFSTCGITDEIAPHKPFVQGVRSTGRRPLDYFSKFSIRLKPKMTARQAMLQIYSQLLDVMEHNQAGIVRDLDTEFLHDFRVAVRRTRSGLGLVKEVLPPGVVEKVKKDLAWLGSITGPTRDLDVYLMDREKYMARLPEKLRPNLNHFFVDLSGRRDTEQKKLIKNLRSSKCREIIKYWHEYLHSDDTGEETPHSLWPVPKLATEIIFSKYKKIMKCGSAIKSSSPDDDLHRLRIQCKKLRYTMEFFASLFPEKR